MFGNKVKPKGFVDTYRSISDEYLVVEGWLFCEFEELIEYKIEGFEFIGIQRLHRPDVNEYLGVEEGNFGFKIVFKGKYLKNNVPDVLVFQDKKLIKKIVNSTDIVLVDSMFSSDLLQVYMGVNEADIPKVAELSGFMDENLSTGSHYLLNGWVNDYVDPIVEVITLDEQNRFSSAKFCRYHRPDIIEAFSIKDKGYLAGIILLNRSQIKPELVLVKTASGNVRLVKSNKYAKVELNRVLQTLTFQESTSDSNINELYRLCFDLESHEILDITSVTENKNTRQIVVNCEGAKASDLARFIVSNEELLVLGYDVMFSSFEDHLSLIDKSVLKRLSKIFNVGVSVTYTKFESLVYYLFSSGYLLDTDKVELLFMKVDMFEEMTAGITNLPGGSYQYGSIRGMGVQDCLSLVSVGEAGFRLDDQGFSLLYGLRIDVSVLSGLRIKNYNNIFSLSKSIYGSLKAIDSYRDDGFRFSLSNEVFMNDFLIKEMQVLGEEVCQ